MERQFKNEKIGVVGLGLMGVSITSCLLAAGHRVVAIDHDKDKIDKAETGIHNNLRKLEQEGFLESNPEELLSGLTLESDIEQLRGLDIVIESIVENPDKKIQLLHELESIVSPQTIIGSNTSAIPVTFLQKDLRHPERVVGLHWAEPAHITRFMEIVCGDETDILIAEKLVVLTQSWGKSPSLLKKDIKGFITNRIMYAMLREAFYLVENGYASIESVDRSLRNDLGYWISFAGPFRFMDLTGIPAYLTVMEDLFPDLDRSTKAPEMMKKMVNSGARGIENAKGFYPYTLASANQWREKFSKFSFDIRKLTERYSENKDNPTR